MNIIRIIIPSRFRTLFLIALQRIIACLVCRGRILIGPFSGMKYNVEAHCSAKFPKLLGTYESELHPLLNKLLKQEFKNVVNVGAAEGYYAVGIATHMKNAVVYAFESNDFACSSLLKLSSTNNVSDRVHLKAKACTPALIQECLDKSSPNLVIMDIEGAEREVLNPDAAPVLLTSTVLVEIHDGEDPCLAELIKSRFENTHNIQEFTAQPRTLKDLPFRIPKVFQNTFVARCALSMLDEFRLDGKRWFYFVPRLS